VLSESTPRPRFEIHERLKDLPLWEGLTYDELRNHFRRDYQTWKEHPHLLRMKGLACGRAPMAPVGDLYRRAERFWNEVLPLHRGKRLLVMSHGGILRALVATALGTPARFFHGKQHSNGGITVFNIKDRGLDHRIEALNLTGHLVGVSRNLKEGKRGLRLVLLPLEAGYSVTLPFLQELKPDFVAYPATGWYRRPLETLRPYFTAENTLRTGVAITSVDSLLPLLLQATGARQLDGIHWGMRPAHISILHFRM
jgi:probable phosphoglycerate mutase